ncbi:hypothetical protein JM946_13920 [Steroidobacter sp. S1-65]|uniref:ATP synthase n=1 Tax=Steroidobacter gossypii TaxID=2805490 RepID=A0ABS1WXZ1_9GAMM|nr:SbcC/MukB-like Walker B domain-containing protein [Steroidobacter gossypii]MBM0105833.1 hypothetical protein [Steroidobacter gossypii]
MDMPISQPVLAESLSRSTFVLTQIDLFNWGAFAGRHSAAIELEGTAIIGPTGSGKTTLVDALMTLITVNPRYNLASTGGHESDRDLVSYIRGVSGAGNNSGDNEHIARPGKTVTGISATFSNGDKSLVIAALFWLDDTSFAAADLKRLWIYSEDGQQTLDLWLETHHAGGARALKQLGRETPGLHVTPNKQEHLAYVRRFFEVGENAFTLLNRAAGLKQLNSIDEVFRELVLEDASRFERAGEVAKEFDDLAAIHGELEIARQQQQTLLPIAESWQARLRLHEALGLQRELQRLLPTWYAELAYRLGGERLAELDALIEARTLAGETIAAQIDALEKQAQALREVYLQSGGATIEQLREQIDQQQDIVKERRRAADDYVRLTRRLGIADALTSDALAANQEVAQRLKAEQQDALRDQKQEAWNLGVVQQRDQQALAALNEELQQIQARPDSNIPGPYQIFRSDLAAHLGLQEEALPFVAELVEVKADESHWRGAIERAIGGHRMRVMAPADVMGRALSWINHRDNRLHVRLLEVETDAHAAEFLADGFTRKLKFKRHAYDRALKRLLSGIDRHCVASEEALRHTPHGMTQQGMMSDKRGLFEKQDKRRLDQDWMTGFDNKDRLASLQRQIKEVEATLQHSRRQYELAQARAEQTEGTLRLLEALLGLEFSAIDLPGAERMLDSFQARLEALSHPDSDLARARADCEQAESELKRRRTEERDNAVEHAMLADRRKLTHENRERAFRKIGAGLTDAQRRLADQHFSAPSGDVLDSLPDLELDASKRTQATIDSLGGKLRDCDQALVRQMASAQRVDTGALSEAGAEIQDVPVYLERLRQLTEEALPQKLQRFLDYLNQSSGQGVTQLLSDIENEVSMIEERIEDLNRTLRRVDFQPGCYLRLDPQRVVHESLRTLQQAQRHLRSAALKNDLGESHFRALKHMVSLLRDASERKKTLGARALLDPRYRLQFSVAVIERATGAVIEVRTGSQGGSGGEKEIIASYVLTASLSYALCPEGGNQPLFGTVVLDEAFSKSSQAVAGRIISALHEFGLHPLFVTPNKELRLLRAHTRSAILIHRKGQRATITSLSWEELEEHARQRNAGRHEVSS